MRNEKGQFIKGNVPWSAGQKGIRLNTGKTHFKKGLTPWNKNKSGLMPTPWNKRTYNLKRANRNLYRRIHGWLHRNFGAADHCSFDSSHKSTQFQYANISGSYHKDINEYAQLCAKCHTHYDLIRQGWKGGQAYGL